MTLLEVHSINSYYGKSHVLFDVSLDIQEGDLVALLGRNGAGKTTTLRSIMGVIEPKSGEIRFRGSRIDGLTPHEIASQGISLIPEHRRIFSNLTVLENLRLGGIGRPDPVDWHENLDLVYEYFPRLKERQDQRAGKMSGGEQQMLSIGRALMSDPDILLVDEPSEGLMPSLVEQVKEILERISADGRTILLVEQNAQLALDLADYGYVLNEGRIEVEGNSKELSENNEIQRRYLAL